MHTCHIASESVKHNCRCHAVDNYVDRSVDFYRQLCAVFRKRGLDEHKYGVIGANLNISKVAPRHPVDIEAEHIAPCIVAHTQRRHNHTLVVSVMDFKQMGRSALSGKYESEAKCVGGKLRLVGRIGRKTILDTCRKHDS